MATENNEINIDSLISVASESFRNQEYQKALQIYTKIISILQKLSSQENSCIRKSYGLSSNPVIGPTVHPKLPSVLDLRAATYEKLNDLRRAVRDGENLVKVDPLGCKGYLRHAKILLLMERELDAYKVLQRGVCIIDSARKRYQISVPFKLLDNLKLKYKVLNDKIKNDQNSASKRSSSDSTMSKVDVVLHKKQKRLSPPISKGIDFFNYLPPELIEKIFMLLERKYVFKLYLVCQNWYQTLIKFPRLYENISFKMKIDKLEFLNGMKLIEKVYKTTPTRLVKYIKLRSTLKQNFFLEAIKYLSFKLHLKFCKLELINPHFSIGDLLISIIENQYLKKDLHGLKPYETLEMLRLGVSSQTRHIPHLVGLLSNLKILEIIHLSDSVTSMFDTAAYNSADALLERKTETLKSLHTLTHIGHPKREGGPVPLMKQVLEGRFPNLKSLTVVSQDLHGCSGTMLSKLFKLQEVHFENNSGYDLNTFLNNFAIGQPQYNNSNNNNYENNDNNDNNDNNNNIVNHSHIYNSGHVKYANIRKLVFRERVPSTDLDLEGYSCSNFPGFASMKHLDLYNSSLNMKDLYKMLEICNQDQQLRVLNLGSSRKLRFPVDQLHRRSMTQSQNIIRINEILNIVPDLTHLYIPEIEFDNFTGKSFYNDLQFFGFDRVNLKVLDLSFCNMDGKGLMDLFCVSNRIPVTFKLEELILDGVEISKNTLDELENRGHVTKVRSSMKKIKWREYGINSLIID